MHGVARASTDGVSLQRRGQGRPWEMMNTLCGRPNLIPLVPRDLFSWEERMLREACGTFFLILGDATTVSYKSTLHDRFVADDVREE